MKKNTKSDKFAELKAATSALEASVVRLESTLSSLHLPKRKEVVPEPRPPQEGRPSAVDAGAGAAKPDEPRRRKNGPTGIAGRRRRGGSRGSLTARRSGVAAFRAKLMKQKVSLAALDPETRVYIPQFRAGYLPTSASDTHPYMATHGMCPCVGLYLIAPGRGATIAHFASRLNGCSGDDQIVYEAHKIRLQITRLAKLTAAKGGALPGSGVRVKVGLVHSQSPLKEPLFGIMKDQVRLLCMARGFDQQDPMSSPKEDANFYVDTRDGSVHLYDGHESLKEPGSMNIGVPGVECFDLVSDGTLRRVSERELRVRGAGKGGAYDAWEPQKGSPGKAFSPDRSAPRVELDTVLSPMRPLILSPTSRPLGVMRDTPVPASPDDRSPLQDGGAPATRFLGK